MKTLVSLDLANQESWSDMRCAVKTMILQNTWEGNTARSQVSDFLKASVYAKANASHVSLFFSGRAALRYILQSLDLPPQTLVALQAFTCTAVVLPVISLGLRPLYIDITDKDFSMNIADLRQKYSSGVKVLILQHSFGIVPNGRAEIVQFCAQHGIFLIEDLAHGFVPQSLAPPSMSDDYCALVSFGRSKLLSSVFGAGVVTPNGSLAIRLKNASKDLSDAPKSLIFRCLLYKILTPVIKNTYFVLIGKILHRLCIMINLFPREISYIEERGSYDSHFEYVYPEPLAQTLQCQISRMPVLLSTIYARVGEYQQNLPHSHYPSTPLNRFPYLLTDPDSRTHILRHFKRLGVLLGTWYDQPVGPGNVDLHSIQYTTGSCPVAEDITKRIINLPTNVGSEVAQYIAHELKKF